MLQLGNHSERITFQEQQKAKIVSIYKNADDLMKSGDTYNPLPNHDPEKFDRFSKGDIEGFISTLEKGGDGIPDDPIIKADILSEEINLLTPVIGVDGEDYFVREKTAKEEESE